MKENIMELLRQPFKAEDIEWRIQRQGSKPKGDKITYWAMVLAYVTNRAIMERLDEVCGLTGWQNVFQTAPDGGVLCGISIYDDEKKEWITKYDGAENTQVEAIKGGLSSAMKRAAVQWGIGRYLYNLDTTFVNLHLDKGNRKYKTLFKSDNGIQKSLWWNAPALPEFAKPKYIGDKAPF
jgi:hypothetical protein